MRALRAAGSEVLKTARRPTPDNVSFLDVGGTFGTAISIGVDGQGGVQEVQEVLSQNDLLRYNIRYGHADGER